MSDVVSILRQPLLVQAGIAERRHYDAGESIIREGENDRSLYLIEEGRARVCGRIELDDHRHIRPGICDLGVGEVFGELALFESAPRSASVVAVDPCELLAFDTERLADYFDGYPNDGYLVLKGFFGVLNRRLRQADRRLESVFAWGLKAHNIDRDL